MLRQDRLVGILGQVAAVLKTGQVGGVVDRALDRAIGLDQLPGAFGADAGHAGDVVDVVSHQAEQVGHLTRQHAILLLDLRRVVEAGLVAVTAQPHVIVDKLQEVFVFGGDDCADAGGRGGPGEGANDVVGLVAVHLDHRDTHRLEDLAHPRELRTQIVRHRRAIGLVLRVFLVPDRLAAGIEDHSDVVGFFLVQELAQHGGEAVGGVRRNTSGRGELRQRVVGAVNLVVGIHQAQLLGGHESLSIHDCYGLLG